MKFVKFLNEIDKSSLAEAGGKGANLGEMFNAGLPVPNTFIVLASAYKHFIETTGIKEKIFKILKETDVNNPKDLQEKTAQIRKIIEETEMPEEIKNEIVEAYKRLSKEFGKGEEYVAVRSSATAEDLPGSSFAGQQLTLLNVKGSQNVVESVKKCWASLFTARATFYRVQKGFKHEKVLIAIPVQKQLGALTKEEYLQGKYKAGVGFTVHPSTGNKTKIVIEASWGQGESVVSGAVTPDTYVIDKETGKVVEFHLGEKKTMRITDLEKGGLVEIETPEDLRSKQCLTEDELRQLWELARKLEEHYKFPQDFEWASENGKVYLLQTRPVTVFYEKKEEELSVKEKPIVKGLPASPGVGIGKVKIVLDLSELEKVEKGDVLVTTMTSPDFVPAMRRASAIVTDEGGMTCVAGDTLLLTNKGFMKAEELYQRIKNGETFSILSFDSSTKNFKFKKIIAAGRNKKRVITVQISNKQKNEKLDILRISPDHKFITFLNGELVKIPLEEILKLNFGVLIPEKLPGLSLHDIDDKDGKLSYIIGLTVTDGYLKLTNRRGSLTLSQKLSGKRKLVVQRFVSYLTSLTQREPKFYPKIQYSPIIGNRIINSQSDNYNIVLHHKRFVSNLFPLVNSLDTTVLCLNEKNIYHFLAGVLDGDGSSSVTNKRLHIYLDPSKSIIYAGIVLALLRLGIHPQVVFNRNIINLQIVEKINDLAKYATRFNEMKFKEREKYKSMRYFIARQILQELSSKTSYKGRLNVYLKKNLLVGEKVLKEIIKECKKKGINTKKLENVLSLPFRQARVRKIKDDGIELVYNFEVEGKNELDKNFVVFTNTLTPVLVSNSHAAIVSRELGVPCIVGTGNATKVLKDGMLVTVDGRRGFVYEGEIKELIAREKALEVSPEEAAKLKTKTKILMNLGEPEAIEKYKHLPFEGIGLMRIEFIIADWVKEHPNYLIERGEEQKYVDKLAEGIAKVAKAIYPRFVVVRFSDFKTNEYRQLKGGEKYEPVEANPMLGWRGVSRYISPQFEKAFRLECRAIKKVRDSGLDNVWVMLPFIRTTWEVEKVLKIMEEEGLKRGEKNFEVWAMVEVPSVVILMDEFCKYFDKFSIGSNDLTMSIICVDRDSAILTNMGYFDERDPAVKRAIKHAIKVAHKYGKSVSICGQAPSVYPEFTEFLVRNNIDSISVNPDVVCKTRKLVYEIEKKLGRI